jgi:hypothetical protein
MQSFTEGLISFDFPNGYVVQKLDAMKFYTQYFQALQKTKSVDLVAFNPDKQELWLLEVKDYRNQERTKPSELFDEIAQKILSSLACLMAMRANSQFADDDERDFAAKAIGQTKLRFVLHLEQAQSTDRLFQPILDPKAARDLLRRLRSIDPDAKLATIARPKDVPWQAK